MWKILPYQLEPEYSSGKENDESVSESKEEDEMILHPFQVQKVAEQTLSGVYASIVLSWHKKWSVHLLQRNRIFVEGVFLFVIFAHILLIF